MNTFSKVKYTGKSISTVNRSVKGCTAFYTAQDASKRVNVGKITLASIRKLITGK